MMSPAHHADFAVIGARRALGGMSSHFLQAHAVIGPATTKRLAMPQPFRVRVLKMAERKERERAASHARAHTLAPARRRRRRRS